METAVTRHPHAAVVTLSGELDADTSGQLRSLLNELLLTGQRNLVLDLSGLSFVDSAGLAALLSAAKGTRRGGGRLLLSGPAPSVRKVMALTGIDVVLTTVDSVDEALARMVAEQEG